MELAHDVRVIGDEDSLGFKLLVAQGDFGRGEHATRLESSVFSVSFGAVKDSTLPA